MQGNTAQIYPLDPNRDLKQAYHNTELLLKKYRRAKLRLKNNMQRMKRELDSGLHAQMDELREMMERHGVTHKEAEFSDMAYNTEMTLKILDYVDWSLECLRQDPEFGEEYYWILYYNYIIPKPVRPTEALLGQLQKKQIYIGRSYYFELKQNAIDALGDILWGYMSKEILEILSLYQDWLE